MLADTAVEPVIVYMRQVARQRHWPEWSDVAITRLVVDEYLSTDLQELFALTDETSPLDETALATAMRHFNVWSVVTWARCDNNIGNAPSSRTLSDQLHHQRPRFLKRRAGSRPWAVAGTAAARTEVRRLRHRFKGRIGQLQPRDELAPAVMQAKTFAAWQWYNFLASHVQVGQKVLRLNLDETGVCLFQGGGKGNVFIAKNLRRQNVTKSAQRTYLTHVAIICDDAELQLKLPQFIIGNERTIPQKRFAALRRACPPNVKLLRAQSAWVNITTFSLIIKELGIALASVLHEFLPILVFDAFRPHLDARIFAACARAHLLPLVNPAKLTWFLQPLDTHTFARYKLHLQRAYQDARRRSESGVVGVAEVLDSIFVVIRQVMEQNLWASAFDRNGFSAGQHAVPPAMWDQLGLDSRIAVASSQPTVDQVRLCFPARCRVPSNVWRPLSTIGLAIGPAASASAPSSSTALHPFRVRLPPMPRAVATSSGSSGPITSRTRSHGPAAT